MKMLRYVAFVCVLGACVVGVPSLAFAGKIFIAATRHIARYDISQHGLIQGGPDLQFRASSDPIAVGADGTLYASIHNAGYYPVPRVLVYKPGETQPLRRFYVPTEGSPSNCDFNGGVYITSLAVDRDGYVFVGYFDVTSLDQSEMPFLAPLLGSTSPTPCAGFQVFGPHANEHSHPLFTFGVPNQIGGEYIVDSAVSQDGSLYAITFNQSHFGYGTVYVFGNPHSQPTLLRTLAWGGPEQITSLSLDDPRGLMYATGTCADRCKVSQVMTFPEQFTPSQLPLSSFDMPGPNAEWWIDNYRDSIYLSLRGRVSGETLTYRKGVSGKNPAVALLRASGEVRVAH